ncbi:MAG: c-type cytochrome [Campylobacter sp.]
MRKFALLVCFFGYCFCANDFITKNEYAKMLYQNPRGIGCDKCHGRSGEGAVISKFKYFDKKTKQILDKELVGPPINNLDLAKFKKAVESSKGIMPSYFLTDEEINLIYEYLINYVKGKR